jgi:hypothetical protein
VRSFPDKIVIRKTSQVGITELAFRGDGQGRCPFCNRSWRGMLKPVKQCPFCYGDPQLPTLSGITIDDSGTPRTPKDDEKAT